MQVHTVQPNQWISYAVTAVIIGIVLFFRMRRMNVARPLRLERLWILPAIYAVFASVVLVEFPPQGTAWLWCALALVLGGALGWQRGKLMRIEVDPETHALNHRPSPAAMLFIVALIAVRAGARQMAALSESTLHLNTLMLTDILLAMALGLLSAQRLEMYLRARKMLDAARGLRPA